MPMILRPLQAITNAPECYDYCWMNTLVENIAIHQKGISCRLVENEDQWHFDQQILRYHSGLHLVITDQQQLADSLWRGWLTLTDSPVVIQRIWVDLEEVFDWEGDRREALLQCLCRWRDTPNVSYRTGSRAVYYFVCRGDAAGAEVRSKLASFGLSVKLW